MISASVSRNERGEVSIVVPKKTGILDATCRTGDQDYQLYEHERYWSLTFWGDVGQVIQVFVTLKDGRKTIFSLTTPDHRCIPPDPRHAGCGIVPGVVLPTNGIRRNPTAFRTH